MDICSAIAYVWDFLVNMLLAAHAFGVGSSNYGSLVAALIATFLAAWAVFLIRENRVKASGLCGVFYIETINSATSYNPHKQLRAFRTLILFTDGYVIQGTSEKTGDISLLECQEYVGTRRCRGSISGRIERNYTKKCVMHIQIVEEGTQRVSTIYLKIPLDKIEKEGRLKGTFYTTAADVIW